MSIFSKNWRKAKRWLMRPSLNSIYREARGVRADLADILKGNAHDPRIIMALETIEKLLKER